MTGSGTRLAIKLSKRRDGAVVLRCERADGTATWMRYEGAKAQYLALHDLAHHAVETTLGHRRGFFGLVAEGWNISDFGTPWPRGPLPADAEPAELIVGFLDTEGASGELWSAAEFNAKASQHFAAHGLAHPPVLDDETLARLRLAVIGIRRQWLALPLDGSLELAFPARVS